MTVSKRVVTILTAVLCLLASFTAIAGQDGTAPPAAARLWYLDLGAGINWLDQESGHPQPADAGFRLSAACGRHLGRRWALELETGYLSNTLPAVEERQEKTLNQVPLLLNLFHLFPTNSTLKPYVGAGLGVMFESDGDDSGGDAGFQFMVGVRHVLSEGKSMGIGYRFIMFGATSALASEPVGNDALLLDLKLAI